MSKTVHGPDIESSTSAVATADDESIHIRHYGRVTYTTSTLPPHSTTDAIRILILSNRLRRNKVPRSKAPSH